MSSFKVFKLNANCYLCLQAAGLVWRCGVLDWLRVPGVVARACNLTFGRLLRSQAPAQGALGATLELQRQQQMELLEQQLQINRARDHRTRHVSRHSVCYIFQLFLVAPQKPKPIVNSLGILTESI
jgi:hypothetical protein